MDWFKKLKKSDEQSTLAFKALPEDPATACFTAFKDHWRQISGIISATSPRPVACIPTRETSIPKIENITADDVETVGNLLEQMIFLLIEEQCSGELFGPILDYTIHQNVFKKLQEWWESSSSYKEQIMLNLLKVYEVLISQAQHTLLHHKELVTPMLQLLSNNYQAMSEELDRRIVLLLNLLCVWMNRDPTLLEVFFSASANHGPTNFLIFSLLIEYIHREGAVGQQARDALLLCMALSAENKMVATYIVQQSNFCPLLATGLSGLYSTLPRHMDVRADDWHCLEKSDWSHVPELINFMNSFDFCNSVVEVSCSSVSEHLLEFLYNGFLVSVFGPSLHKTSANEVVVTTAYLNLFLRSVTAPALMRCFLRFLLTHRHESSLIINTLIQRIASGNRLALVSLSLIRTLIDLNCEDLMLQLVFRYLVPCQHILASQRRAICDVDIYNASASRFLALTPTAYVSEAKLCQEDEIFLPVVHHGTHKPKKESSVVSQNSLPEVKLVPDVADGNGPFHTLSPPQPVHASAPIKPTFHSNSENHGMPLSNGVNHAVSEYTVNEDLSVTVNVHSATSSGAAKTERRPQSRTITSPSTMAEFGPDLQSQLQLNTSYMDYLEDAKLVIDQCRDACTGWSAAYDGVDPIDVSAPSCDAVQEVKLETCDESDEIIARVEEEPVISDTLQSSTSDATMKALSATYQALNLTALVFDKSKDAFPLLRSPDSEDPPKLTNGVSVETSTADTVKFVGIQKETNGQNDIVKISHITHDTQHEFPQIRKSLSNALKSKSSPENKLLERPIDKPKISSSTSPQHTEDAEATSPSAVTASSVDEFFRGLMEIVPKTTRDKVESSREKKECEARPDEDIESGIEISSDGDAQATSNERVFDDVEERGECSNHDEDSMSQLSLNTDEIENGTERTSKCVDRSYKDLNTREEILNSRNYSYGEDTDDEFDDTASITSSSFYEPIDEYGPTEVSVGPEVPLKLQGLPYTGPLIGNLFAKLDQMVSNSLYENLLLTGIVARLAAYPQPLLRSFLLNTHMVFHPSVRSLYQVLNSARNKIDSYADHVGDFNVLVRRAQKYLLARGTYPFSGEAAVRSSIKERPMPVPKVKSRTLGDMFKRKKKKDSAKKKPLIPTLETLLERQSRSNTTQGGNREPTSKFYVRQQVQQDEKEDRKLRELRTKNAVYASIVLAEFLKELAAVAQEHAVAQT